MGCLFLIVYHVWVDLCCLDIATFRLLLIFTNRYFFTEWMSGFCAPPYSIEMLYAICCNNCLSCVLCICSYNGLYKRLCYCRGTARRATLIEILWPFLTGSANPEEPCEHTVSWNRVKCCTNVRRIACENVCNRWMIFKIIQGHCRCHHLIGHILFPISLPL